MQKNAYLKHAYRLAARKEQILEMILITMKKMNIMLTLSCLLLGLAGCGNADRTMEVSSQTDILGQDRVETVTMGCVEYKKDQEDHLEQKKSTESIAVARQGESADQGTEKGQNTNWNQDLESEKITEASETEETEAEEEEERELTEDEIKKLQWSLRSSDNGFFACQYYRPEEIDWQQVFYMGAGMNVALNEGQLEIIRENMREEIRQQRIKEQELWDLYLYTNEIFIQSQGEEEEEAEEEVIEVDLNAGDVTTLTLRSIQNFVKSRTNIEYSEARKPLDWPQLTRNVFYFVRKGNNRVQVKLVRGTVKGNLYHLYYRLGNKRGAVEPEYVMTVEKEGNQWKYFSNLSLKKTQPITLLDIDYYSSGEFARLQGCKDMYSTVEENAEEWQQQLQEAFQNSQSQNGSKTNKNNGKNAVKEPVPYWAVITAREDNTRIALERAYLADDVSEELAKEKYFIPGENLFTITLQKGEKIGIRVKLEEIPKYRIWSSSENYFGEYAFGSENSLKRTNEDGTPKSTYVVGYDLNGEHRGTEYVVKEDLLAFLKGTWVYYDGMQGNYTAKLVFDDADKIHLSVTGLTYELECAKWNRIYADEGKAPDVITFKTADENTQELINQWYPAIRKKMGDYRIRAIQKDGLQMLYLTPENSGAGCLSYLLPGASEDTDEFVFYRFIGATYHDEGEEDKG